MWHGECVAFLFFFWFWLLGSECLFLKFFVYPIAKMLMKLLLFSLGWGWFTCLAVGPHVGAWLFCKVLTFLLPSVLYISELCWNSRIWPLVLNSLVSCDFMFNFTFIMLQSHCEHVALLFFFFWFWLLASECPYWRRFAYYCKKDVEVIIQPGVGSHASHWVLLFC